MVTRGERAARSPLLAVPLLLAAGYFLIVRWRGTDWTPLGQATAGWIAAAALAYAAALALLALSAGLDSEAFRAGIAAQLFKYVPGGVFQAQPLVAAGGLFMTGRFTLGVLSGAAFSVAGGVDSGWRWVGVGATALIVAVSWKWLGTRVGLRVVFCGAGAAVLLGLSGAATAAALATEPLPMGRAVAGAWGTGVLALPIPAGLGVREAALTALGGAGAPLVAAAHRAVTLAVDVLLGGMAIIQIKRSSR